MPIKLYDEIRISKNILFYARRGAKTKS